MIVMYSYDPQGFIYLDDQAADVVSALADYLVAVEGGSARVEPARISDDVYSLVSRLRSAVSSPSHPFSRSLDDLMSAFDSDDGIAWVDALSHLLAKFESLFRTWRSLRGQPELF